MRNCSQSKTERNKIITRGKKRNGENEMNAYAEIKYFGKTWLDQIINK